MFRLTTTASFERQLQKFAGNHPELKKKIAQVFRDLEKDPFSPHLRFHPLKGRLKGLYAVSVTYHYRIVLTVRISEREIVLLDIGTHDQVYE